jgi:hypothetical protein
MQYCSGFQAKREELKVKIGKFIVVQVGQQVTRD